jgi:TPR repeat protein
LTVAVGTTICFFAMSLGVRAVRFAQSPTTEITRLIQASENDDPKAQLSLAERYSTGTDVVQSDASAFWWFRRAGEHGIAKAEFEVGRAYQDGKGVERDDSEAHRWFIAAAEQGLAPAQTKVGVALASGTGVEQDDAAAYRWFRRAADQQEPEAQYWVGRGFETGASGEMDRTKATESFRAAAEQGYAPAQYETAHAFWSSISATGRDPFEAYKWLTICGTLASEVQSRCIEGRDRMQIYFGSDRLADADRKARDWLAAFEDRKQK